MLLFIELVFKSLKRRDYHYVTKIVRNANSREEIVIGNLNCEFTNS